MLKRNIQKYKEPRTRVNERILYNTKEVRAISSEGEQLGIITVRDALEKARAVNLDLVEVAPNAKPPVCKILDYGKYKYEEAKKSKAAKAKQHIVKTKEIKLHPKTDINDYTYRLEQGKEFLAKGFKLRGTVVFRGRELAHKEYGSRWIKKMEEDLEGLAIVESPAKQEGRNVTIVFGPLKSNKSAANKQSSKEDSKPEK
ncbi:MAG: translation initiation factor IF-3 [Fibrobacteria bacterium]|nr:translation initiation factor IF-3 [Fibrobacteria bacterium]